MASTRSPLRRLLVGSGLAVTFLRVFDHGAATPTPTLSHTFLVGAGVCVIAAAAAWVLTGDLGAPAAAEDDGACDRRGRARRCRAARPHDRRGSATRSVPIARLSTALVSGTEPATLATSFNLPAFRASTRTVTLMLRPTAISSFELARQRGVAAALTATPERLNTQLHPLGAVRPGSCPSRRAGRGRRRSAPAPPACPCAPSSRPTARRRDRRRQAGLAQARAGAGGDRRLSCGLVVQRRGVGLIARDDRDVARRAGSRRLEGDVCRRARSGVEW